MIQTGLCMGPRFVSASGLTEPLFADVVYVNFCLLADMPFAGLCCPSFHEMV